MSSPLAQIYIPYPRLSIDGSGLKTPHIFTQQFSCVRFLPVWKSKKHPNSEPNSL